MHKFRDEIKFLEQAAVFDGDGRLTADHGQQVFIYLVKFPLVLVDHFQHANNPVFDQQRHGDDAGDHRGDTMYGAFLGCHLPPLSRAETSTPVFSAIARPFTE